MLKSTAAAGLAAFFQIDPARAGEPPASNVKPRIEIDPALRKDWLGRWSKAILDGAKHDRYCDKETGEELGWLVSPYLNGFYYGYLATGDTQWIDHLIDWSDAWTTRSTKEPDGFPGWPKADGASTGAVASGFTDNMLGEAMALRPMVLIAGEINSSAALKSKYGEKARSFVDLAEQIFKKWDTRECWRETAAGGLWVIPDFGFDQKNNRFTEGYEKRKTTGFSLPDNKQNLIAGWMLSLLDVTGKPDYGRRAERWFATMKSRMRVRDGKYFVWNYWDAGGPWDYKPNGETRHWVGVHPNGGYYGIDVEGIVAAYQHNMVFDKADIERLIATNRDYMWNGKIDRAKFQRIDGEAPDARWKNSPGVLWDALIPYDARLQKVFEANNNPQSWGGMAATPWYLSLAAKK
jgi:hypothetical protein